MALINYAHSSNSIDLWNEWLTSLICIWYNTTKYNTNRSLIDCSVSFMREWFPFRVCHFSSDGSITSTSEYALNQNIFWNFTSAIEKSPARMWQWKMQMRCQAQIQWIRTKQQLANKWTKKMKFESSLNLRLKCCKMKIV